MKNNESLGITVEYLLCFYSDIEYNNDLTRVDNEIKQQLSTFIKEIISKIPKIIEFIGVKNIKNIKDYRAHDFLLENDKTLSVKTNTNIKGKVSPQIIGQLTLKKFYERYYKLFNKNFTSDITVTKYNKDKRDNRYVIADSTITESINIIKLKEIIISNIKFLLEEYYNNLFISDYLLWIYYDKIWKFCLIKNKQNVIFDEKLLLFTRDSKLWNNSNTIKFNGKALGEFQIHKTRNSSLTFRFVIERLLLLLDIRLVDNLNVNYIGSKKTLYNSYHEILTQYLQEKKDMVIGDLMCGTGVVSKLINDSFSCKEIIINDLQKYATIITKARLDVFTNEEIKEIETFEKLLLQESNAGFFTINYSNKYFIKENCNKIDGIRQKINTITNNDKIKNFLLACLICSADSVANTSSVYGSYLKKD